MIKAVAAVLVRDYTHKPTRANKTQLVERRGAVSAERRIVRNRQTAEIYWPSIAVENFEPVVSFGRIGHPFIDSQKRAVAKGSRRAVQSARRGVFQQHPFTAIPANRKFRDLKAIRERIDSLPAAVQQVHFAALNGQQLAQAYNKIIVAGHARAWRKNILDRVSQIRGQAH